MMRKLLWLGLALLMAGCSVIEQRPEEVEKQLSEPTRGKLFVPEPDSGSLR